MASTDTAEQLALTQEESVSVLRRRWRKEDERVTVTSNAAA